jgi:hypothetical protein
MYNQKNNEDEFMQYSLYVQHLLVLQFNNDDDDDDDDDDYNNP